MNESQWDEKLRSFLKKTGDELKRAGADIKVEAEKLMKEVKDPERQDKVKKGLETFGLWARKTAEEVAHAVEVGVKKAEGAVRSAVDTTPGAPSAGAPVPETPAAPADEAAAPPPRPSQPVSSHNRHDTPVDTPAVSEEPPKKTIGSSKKKASAKKGAAKKPLGKKRAP